jgi:GNAT superfamily N-acetyltransferase
MIRTATRSDLESITSLLASANATPYDIAAVAEEKCFGRGFFGDAVPFVEERDGAIVGAAVTSGRWIRLLAVDPKHRRQGIGSALLEHAEKLLLGERRIVAAAEAGNYFTPGIIESDEATRKFLEARAFREFTDTWNLEMELRDEFEVPPEVRRATQADRKDVLDFVSQHFGHIWRFEAEHAFSYDPPRVFIIEADGKIAGFSAHDANNRGLGTFGPTGVATSMRRRGYGRLLLRASLADLYAIGYRHAVIPWTDAFEFYRDCCGAQKTHRFITYVK